MTKAQEDLKEDINKIQDDTTIEKVRIFIMGILAQQDISDKEAERSVKNDETPNDKL